MLWVAQGRFRCFLYKRGHRMSKEKDRAIRQSHESQPEGIYSLGEQ